MSRSTQDEARARVMEAGRELFGTRGYVDVRHDEITRAAKISNRRFYTLFRDVGALLSAVVLDVSEEVEAVLKVKAEEGAEKALEEQVGDIIERYVRLMTENPKLLRILHWESHHVKVGGRWRGVLMSTLEPLLKEHGLSERMIRVRLVCVLGAIDGVLMDWREGGGLKASEVAGIAVRVSKNVFSLASGKRESDPGHTD
ncbi:TetR/AcrR family transcriptional regulator [Nonomuraea sp. NPDC048892]|uniref:TetR/AcrR family transcriptional regulator n=1 Tax=Nonomuraea sp. NPDC048892 TaxID=3154624 RepID=UPI0033E10393